MKIVVVDDHPLARKGIISIIKNNIYDCSISEEGCVEGALTSLHDETVSIMFIDLKLGDEYGLDIVKEGINISPETKYIVITSYLSTDNFKVAEGLNVSGYISKCAAPEDITYIVNLVMRGKKYYDSDLFSQFKKTDPIDTGTATLTEREKEVLTELGKGLSNEEISKRLFISVNTVKKHISNIMSKLSLENRTQLVLYLNKRYSNNTGASYRFV